MKAPFRYLLYREAVMTLKYMKSTIIGFVTLSAMFLLTRLSYEYGNFAIFFNSEDKAVMAPILAYVDLMPVMMIGMLPNSISETSQHEASSAWKKFRLSLPVSTWKYTLAKFIFTAIVFAAEVLLGTGYMVAIGALSGAGFSVDTLATILLIQGFLLAFSIVMNIFVLIFGTVERAGIAIAIITFIFFGKIFSNPDVNFDYAMDFIKDAGKYLPFIALAIVGIMAVGYVATALMLKRRER